MGDVGKSKAEVAAERVMARVSGVSVTPHFCRIEDKPTEWYQDFHLIVLGLDSLEARSWINGVVCSFLGAAADYPHAVLMDSLMGMCQWVSDLSRIHALGSRIHADCESASQMYCAHTT